MRRRNLRSASWLVFFLAAAALALAAGARAAEVVVVNLRNGDRVTGEFISETATDLTVYSAALGNITIPMAEISWRQHPRTLTPEIGSANVAPPTNNVSTVERAAPAAPAIVKTNAPPPPKPKHWNSEVQLGLNLRYSTRDQQEFLVIAKTTYSKGRFREILDYNFSHGETEEVLTSHRMGGSSKTEWDITPKFYAFGLGGASYDEIRRIERQYEINPGFGYQWIKKPDFVFKTEIGMGYQSQIFTNGREVEAFSGRLAGIFTWRIWDKLLADGRAEYFPNVETADQYRLRLESTLRYPLMKNLSLNLIVIDLYDTQAPPGVENNDLQVRSAVGVKF